jgi:5-formyltetrahydrofolate cyclo-ligase
MEAVDPGALKAALRRRFRTVRRAVRPALRARLDELAQATVVASPQFARAARVALYRAFDGEPGTGRIADAARDAGKQVVYARFARGVPLTFVEPRGWTTERGVPQPVGPEVTLAAGDLVVVPGLCFDRDGFRLGHGGGHYDRTLAQHAFATVGLAFERQRVRRQPLAPWGRPVSALATERALYTFSDTENPT